MSLQIWLPLNGNLENQGLTDIEATNAGATTNANGKIGSCYYFDGTSSRIGFPEIAISYPISICAWIKGETITASGTEYILSYNTPTGGTSGHAIGFGTYTGKLSIWHGGTVHSYGTALTNNVWYHVTAIVTESSYGLYLNGNLVLSGSGTQTAVNAKCITIGARSNNSGGGAAGAAYFFKGFMNDVRLYDHALSAKEVRELAKGLVLHYKLDDEYTEGTTNYLTANGSCANFRNYTVAAYATSVDSKCAIGNYIITYSLYINNTSNVPLNARCSPLLVAGSYGTFQGNAIPAGSAGWSKVTCDLTDTSKYTGEFYPYVQNGSYSGTVPSEPNFQVWHAQAERKNHQTPWILGGTTRTPTTVYDSSGFGYNGTPANVETLSGPPRYLKSTHFTGSTSKIHIPNLLTSGFSTTYTFTWWGKTNSWSSKMFWGFQNGTRLNLYNGIYWNTGDGSSDPIYIPGTTTTITAPSLNVWHHYAMTCGGTSCLLYLDGALYGQAKTVKSITGTDIWFNGWDSGGSYTLTDMAMTDFRMYSTALSADDILELYHTSASIDKSGNIYARELVE